MYANRIRNQSFFSIFKLLNSPDQVEFRANVFDSALNKAIEENLLYYIFILLIWRFLSPNDIILDLLE